MDIQAVDNRRHVISDAKRLRRAQAPSRARYEIQAGDVLFSLVRPYLRNIARVPPELDGQIASSAFCVLRASPLVNPDYLFYMLLRDEFVDEVVTYGESPPAARDEEFLKLRIPLPPLQEQGQIVAFLEQQFSRLESATDALAAAAARIRVLREQVIRSAVTGSLDGGEPNGRDMSDIRVPEHWRWAKLGEVADVVGGVTKDQRRSTLPDASEVPYLRVANVQRAFLDLADVKTIRVTSQELAKLRLLKGDILFNEGGDRDKLGRGWVWAGEIDPCVHQNHVFRARLREKGIDPRFVAWYANSVGRAYFFAHGKQSTNLASINRSQLVNLPIPIPPEEEQGSILEKLDRELTAITQLDGTIRAAVARATALRKMLLRQAGSGNLIPSRGLYT